MLEYWDRFRYVRSTRNQLLEYLENRLTEIHKILHRHLSRHCLQPYRYDVIIDFRSDVFLEKTVENTAFDGNGGISRERFKLGS